MDAPGPPRAASARSEASTRPSFPTVRVASNGTVAVQHYDFRFDNPATTPPLTTDTWLLRSTNGGASWTEERIGTMSFDMTTAPDALGYFVGDYAGRKRLAAG